MQTRKLTLLLAAAFFLYGSVVFAVWKKTPDEKIWDQYMETRIDFEKNVHNLVVEKWPQHRDIAHEHLDLELARLKQKTAQFEYLDKNDPKRITRDKGVEQFVAFDWSDKDDANLKRINHRYAEKSREIERLQNQYESRKGRREFEKQLDDVKDTVEYKSFEDRFQEMVSKLETSYQQAKRELKD